MEVLKELPPEASVLSPKTRAKYWLLANRVRIGLFLLAASTAVGATWEWKGSKEQLHAIDMLVVLLFAAGGSATAAAGAFKSNAYHEREMHAEIRGKSGGFDAPLYADRKDDTAMRSLDAKSKTRHRP